jgi:hypothetical protein
MKKPHAPNSNGRFGRRYPYPTVANELRQVIRAIQELSLDLAQGDQKRSGPELEAKKRELEQLRWRLATLARRSANEDFGAAA